MAVEVWYGDKSPLAAGYWDQVWEYFGWMVYKRRTTTYGVSLWRTIRQG